MENMENNNLIHEDNKPVYTFKSNPYEVVTTSSFKITDLANKKEFTLPNKWYLKILPIRWLLILLFKLAIKLLYGRSFWISVVIYEGLYYNPEGDIWVRDKESFFKLFKKK
jgi:hypothetical protein